jgi:hypothetical protein
MSRLWAWTAPMMMRMSRRVGSSGSSRRSASLGAVDRTSLSWPHTSRMSCSWTSTSRDSRSSSRTTIPSPWPSSRALRTSAQPSRLVVVPRVPAGSEIIRTMQWPWARAQARMVVSWLAWLSDCSRASLERV